MYKVIGNKLVGGYFEFARPIEDKIELKDEIVFDYLELLDSLNSARE